MPDADPVELPPPCVTQEIRILAPGSSGNQPASGHVQQRASGQGPRGTSAVRHFVPASNRQAAITLPTAVTCAAHVFKPHDERHKVLLDTRHGTRIMKDHLPNPPLVRVDTSGMANLYNRIGKVNFI